MSFRRSSIDILEELLLCYQLPVFTKRAKRELISHKKFYLFDSGVFVALRPKGALDIPEEINGAALEGLVAQHLQAWNDYGDNKHLIAFWRTKSGLEVDFIVYGDLGFWAIEVKNIKQIHSVDLRGLKVFLEDYPMAKALILYRGTERVMCDGVLCLPCDNFLVNLKPNFLIV